MADDDDSEAIYGNSDAIIFHKLTTTGGLLHDVGEAKACHPGNISNGVETYDDDYDDFSSDDEAEDTGHHEIQPREETFQPVKENVKERCCYEDVEPLVLDPKPPKSLHSQPRGPVPLPLPNKARPHHQEWEVPWKTESSVGDAAPAKNRFLLVHERSPGARFQNTETCKIQPREKTFQPVQKENVQERRCYEDVEPLVLESKSPKSLHSQPRGPAPLPPPNKARPHHQECEVPWKTESSVGDAASAKNKFLPVHERSPGDRFQNIEICKIQPREKTFQPVQKENVQGRSCYEEVEYLILDPESPKSLDFRTDSPPLIPPPKKHSLQDQESDVPWKTESLVGYDASSKNRFSPVHRPGGPFQNSTNPWKSRNPGTVGSSSRVTSCPIGPREIPLQRNLPPLIPPVSRGPLPKVSLEDGENIILIPLYEGLMEKPYFHLLSRDGAKKLVLQGGDGAFLIRPSTKSSKPLTITINYRGSLYHVNIRQRIDKLFALGNHQPGEKAFSTIEEIVCFHHETPLSLSSGAHPVLKYSPRKPDRDCTKHAALGHKRNQY